MGYIIDIIIIAIMVICIVYGAKKGFFKSLMSLVTGICALLIAFTFTPMLSSYINENHVMDALSDGIETTFMSIAESDTAISGYDKNLLFNDSQFLGLMEGAGYSEKEIEDEFFRTDTGDEALIAYLADTVAAPIAKTISNIIAFIILFLASFIILKIVTAIIGIFLKLPVLKELDRVLGVVFGIVSAVFFALVFSMMVSHLANALADVAPGTFNTDIIENSLLLELLAKYNPVSALAGVLMG